MESPRERAPRHLQDEVWSLLYARQRIAIDGAMCLPFVEGVESLEQAGLDPRRMPSHRWLSDRLRDLCGWRMETVSGLIPVSDFFALLRDRRFPSPEWIRHPRDLEFTPEPDLFHDVFGHVPQLASPTLREAIEALADLSRGADEARFADLERLYWFTIEFGLVLEGQSLRALGAGLASSIGELQRALHDGGVQRRPFSVEAAISATFDPHRPQPIYMTAASAGRLGSELRGAAEILTPTSR